MGIRSQKFEGIETRIPGTYVAAEFPDAAGASGVSLNNVVIIGSAKGGIPYNATGLTDEALKLNRVNTAAQAQNILRGGAGYYMTEIYLNPSKDPRIPRPAQAFFIRVDPAVQSARNFKTGGGASNVVDLKSARYGTLANQLNCKLEAGTTVGYKITAKFQGATLLEKDNVAQTMLIIQYVGAGSAATLTVNATTLTTAVTGGPGGENLSLNFSDYNKLQDLVAYIDEQTAYTCTLVGSSDASPTTLDALAAVDIQTAPVTAYANIQAVIDTINNESKGEIIASLSVGAARVVLDYDSVFVFFTSGTDGTATTSDWTAAFALAEKFAFNHILVATGDPTIHAIADAHVSDMSQITGKRNRSCGYGATLAKTKAQRISEAKASNNPRAEYWVTPIRRPDAFNNNVTTTFDPFYGAALGAGIRFGNDPTAYTEFQAVNVLGVTEIYDRTDMEDYIAAGCSLIQPDGDQIVVVSNTSTYQGDNLILNLPSMLRTADAITLYTIGDVTKRIANLKRAPSELAVKDLENYLRASLLPRFRDQFRWLTNDPTTGDPAFDDVTFTLIGDRVDFGYTGILPAPIRFAFIKERFIFPGFSLAA